MELYKDLYFKLFAVIADAVEALEDGKADYARKMLIAAEQEAEELYLRQSESEKMIDYQNLLFRLLDEVKGVLGLMSRGMLSEAEGALLAAAHCAEDDIEASGSQTRTSVE